MSSSRTIELRVPRHLANPLRAAVAHRGWRESVAFGLASHAKAGARTLLLLRKIRTLPDGAYVRGSGHGAQWTGASMVPMLNEALLEDLGIIVFHSHPHAGPVSLSTDDIESSERLLPVFQNLIPTRPHASIVLGTDHLSGVVLLPGAATFQDGVTARWLGKVVVEWPSGAEHAGLPEPEAIFYRQALLTGSAGEMRLRRATVAVVGLSGGGSHVVQQLARMGIGHIIGVDHDRVDKPGRSRVIGLSALDVLLRRRKTAVMARMVRRTNRRVRFTGVRYAIPRQEAIDAIKGADIVVGCVDSYHARADLQEVASRFLIPYVDVGLMIQPLENGSGVTIGGNVITSIPGEFCQWCVGALSQEKVDAETGGHPRSYYQGTDKQAQVVSMNGLLASAAVTEVLQVITGFAPVDEELSIKKYDGLRGTLSEWLVHKGDCPRCELALGAGETVWKTV